MLRDSILILSVVSGSLFGATLSPPARVSLTVLTPPEKIISGDTIRFVISIIDTEVLPEKISVQDIVAPNTSLPQPFFMVGNATAPVTMRSDTASYLICDFTDSVDTINIVLYETTFDFPHKLYFEFGSFEISTFEFIVSPRSFCRIALESAGANHRPDTIFLSNDSPLTLNAVGLDQWGNRFWGVPAYWRTTGTLPPIGTDAQSADHMHFPIQPYLPSANGFIIITAVDDSTMRDSVFVTMQKTSSRTDRLGINGRSHAAITPVQYFDLAGRRVVSVRTTAPGVRLGTEARRTGMLPRIKIE